MYNSKNIIIHNTSSAALFQLTDIYFDNLTNLFNNLNNEANKTEEKSVMNEKILQNYDIYKYLSINLSINHNILSLFNIKHNIFTINTD